MRDRDVNTEQKIIEAARDLFIEKGYAATTTRDIAERAEVNTALVHYYYRNKENLFHLVLVESLQKVFMVVDEVINNEETTLSEKIDAIVKCYTSLFEQHKHLLLFVLSELRSNPDILINDAKIPADTYTGSVLYKQIDEQIAKESLDTTPVELVVNIVSMVILPIMAAPMIQFLTPMNDNTYRDFIKQRQTLIPTWIKSILKLQ